MIYSGLGEAAELLIANNCGLVAQPERPDLLAGAITTLASQPRLRWDLARKGRALVEKEYSWSAIVERWLSEIGLVEDTRPAKIDAVFPPLNGDLKDEELALP